MKDLLVKIVTPDGKRFESVVKSITVRTTNGDVEFMRGHADFLGLLGTGRARLVLEDGTERLASISGGFVSVSDGVTTLLATTVEFADEIDLKRAERAKADAEAALATVNNEKDEKVLKAKLARAISRISVGNTIK